MDFFKLAKMAKDFGLEVFGLYYSSYPGYVVDNNDPSNQNRLQITVPQLIDRSTVKLWAYPKNNPSGDNWGSQVLPRPGDMVWVTFQNGKLLFPLWEHYYPLKGKKPSAFTSVNIFGFVSPKGIEVIIDDDNETVTVKAKKVVVESTSTLLSAKGGGADQKIPLGEKLDEDLTTLLGLMKSMQTGLSQMASTGSAACTTPPLSGLASVFSQMEALSTGLSGSIATLESHLSSGYHLSNNSKTN